MHGTLNLRPFNVIPGLVFEERAHISGMRHFVVVRIIERDGETEHVIFHGRDVDGGTHLFVKDYNDELKVIGTAIHWEDPLWADDIGTTDIV